MTEETKDQCQDPTQTLSIERLKELSGMPETMKRLWPECSLKPWIVS